jgi:hypothetical protein
MIIIPWGIALHKPRLEASDVILQCGIGDIRWRKNLHSPTDHPGLDGLLALIGPLDYNLHDQLPSFLFARTAL